MAKSTSNLFDDNDKKEVVESKVPEVDDIQDIDLSSIKKKKFRINGDNSKILELNTSDLNIVARLGEAYPRLDSLMSKVQDKISDMPDNSEDATEEDFKKLSDVLKELDDSMRKEIDYIFNEPVSEVCGSEGNMWDPIDGSFRYEHIIEKISALYENNFNEEFKRMKAKVNAKTKQYTKKGANKK